MCAVARGRKASAAAAVSIWHNPKCATSRKVLALIRGEGIEPEIVEYLKHPPGATEIKAALKDMGMKPRALLRRRGTPYDELGLDSDRWTDGQMVATMVKHPVLIERPVVRTRKGTRLCRPPDRLHDIL